MPESGKRKITMGRIITVDGPAGSGKSTISRMLAEKIRFIYLDTGAMYRAVALAAVRSGIHLADAKRLGDLCRSLDLHFEASRDTPRLFMRHEDISSIIRNPEMDLGASSVSAVKEVREAMSDLQRKMVQGRDVVAEGRDMGTVVFPEADYKFFLTASAEVRAERRYRERRARGENVSREAVLESLQQRDFQDETRALAPLKPADDAIIIDSTGFSIAQVLDKILACLERK